MIISDCNVERNVKIGQRKLKILEKQKPHSFRFTGYIGLQHCSTEQCSISRASFHVCSDGRYSLYRTVVKCWKWFLLSGARDDMAIYSVPDSPACRWYNSIMCAPSSVCVSVNRTSSKIWERSDLDKSIRLWALPPRVRDPGQAINMFVRLRILLLFYLKVLKRPNIPQ